MSEKTQQDSHEHLRDLIETHEPESVRDYLASLPVEDLGYVVNRLDLDDQVALMDSLSKEHAEVAASLVEHLPDTQTADLFSLLPPAAAANIFEEMDSDDRADVLAEMTDPKAAAVLAELEPEEARDAKHLIGYDSNTAGGLMITEYLSHPMTFTIQQVLEDMRTNAEQYSGYDVQYVYVTDEPGRLIGVIRLRDLVLTPGDATLDKIVIRNPRKVRTDESIAQLEGFFDEHGYFAVPVVDPSGVLVGVVRRAAVEAAHAEGAGRALMAFGGIIGGEELRSMPTRNRVARRLAFLCPNIVLNMVAASVVAYYEPTIAAVTALAIFLPMLSDMSGCAGNQAVAVSIRELSLGLLKPKDLFRTLQKEVGIGVINGVVLGTLVGLIAWAMRGDDWPLIGVVVGGAMCINSVLAVVIGGTVPLVLKRARVDPALAASPILTTFTDMCGFFLTLRLATALLL
ncbi:MAG: hypothetical protein RJA70_939 [Pseudomonadota bacterium]|jgi:magnesium transporter